MVLAVVAIALIGGGLWIAIGTARRWPRSGEVPGDAWPPTSGNPWWRFNRWRPVPPPPEGMTRSEAWRRARTQAIWLGVVFVVGGLLLLALVFLT